MIELPPCNTVIASIQSEFREWEQVGHMRNQGTEVYIFKMPDSGEDASYVRFMFTESKPNIEYGIATGWRYMPDLRCIQAGVTNYVIMQVTKAKEKV